VLTRDVTAIKMFCFLSEFHVPFFETVVRLQHRHSGKETAMAPFLGKAKRRKRTDVSSTERERESFKAGEINYEWRGM